MSVVVAIKYKYGVIIGADKQISGGNIKIDTETKIKHSHYSNTAIGICGALRDLDIIMTEVEDLMEYKDILDNIELDKTYAIKVIVPKIFRVLKESERLQYEDKIPFTNNSYIIVNENNIFRIEGDGAVIEEKNYSTIGCGDQLAKGYLDVQDIVHNKLTKDSAIELVENAIKRACKDDIYIGSNIDILFVEKEKKDD